MKDVDRIEAIVERFEDQLKGVAEIVTDMAVKQNKMQKDIDEIKEKLDKQDVYNLVVKDHSEELSDHEQRISFVEKQVA